MYRYLDEHQQSIENNSIQQVQQQQPVAEIENTSDAVNHFEQSHGKYFKLVSDSKMKLDFVVAIIPTTTSSSINKSHTSFITSEHILLLRTINNQFLCYGLIDSLINLFINHYKVDTEVCYIHLQNGTDICNPQSLVSKSPTKDFYQNLLFSRVNLIPFEYNGYFFNVFLI